MRLLVGIELGETWVGIGTGNLFLSKKRCVSFRGFCLKAPQRMMHVSEEYAGVLKRARRILLIRVGVVLILAIATLLRLIMSLSLHMWYAYEQSFDDELLMSYTWREHFLADGPLTLAEKPRLFLLPSYCLSAGAERGHHAVCCVAVCRNSYGVLLAHGVP